MQPLSIYVMVFWDQAKTMGVRLVDLGETLHFRDRMAQELGQNPLTFTLSACKGQKRDIFYLPAYDYHMSHQICTKIETLKSNVLFPPG